MRSSRSERDAAWAARIGHDSVACRRRARSAARVVAVTFLVAAVCAMAGVWAAAATDSGPAPAPVVAAVTVLFFVAATSAIVGGAVIGAVLLPRRQLALGYALRALLLTNPGMQVGDLAPHLRSLDDFDGWARAVRLVPYDPDAVPLERWLWRPGLSRAMLPGRAASWWIGAAVVLARAGIVGFAVSSVTELATHGSGPAAVIVFSVSSSILATVGIVRVVAALRTRREGREGYTTIVGRSRGVVIDCRTAFDLVDARTGFVVRTAGALPLSTALYRARVRAVRGSGQGTGFAAS